MCLCIRFYIRFYIMIFYKKYIAFYNLYKYFILKILTYAFFFMLMMNLIVNLCLLKKNMSQVFNENA